LFLDATLSQKNTQLSASILNLSLPTTNKCFLACRIPAFLKIKVTSARQIPAFLKIKVPPACRIPVFLKIKVTSARRWLRSLQTLNHAAHRLSSPYQKPALLLKQ
ncbi:MAG: hypothetical protein Q4A10_05830, partial [Aerococcaceae bacterium]|nr:hypothetical protein [Aerococcaceae bacterium]